MWPLIASAAMNSAEAVAVVGTPEVKVGWTPTTYMVGGLLAMAIAHFMKGLPGMYRDWIDRDGQLRGEKRNSRQTTETRLQGLEDRVQRMTTTMAFLANAVTISNQALDSDDMDERHRAKEHSRELVEMAIATMGVEDPFVSALRRVAAVSGKPGA